jgi:hypothetical protein
VISLFRFLEAMMVFSSQDVSGGEIGSTAVQDSPERIPNPGATITLNDHRVRRGGKLRLHRRINRWCAQIGLSGQQRSESPAQPGLSDGEQEKVIDSLIVARAFVPEKRRRRGINWRAREIMLAAAGGALTLLLLFLLIYIIQTM